MLVKIQGRRVDVLDSGCAKRDCYQLGFDKGSFSPGRGYTNYHTDAKGRRIEKPVCATRLHRGCPVVSVCPRCRSAGVEPVGTRCNRPECNGVTEAP